MPLLTQKLHRITTRSRMKNYFWAKIITLTIGIHCGITTPSAATELEIAQVLTALLIAPTSWAAYTAQVKNASPKTTNGMLILADINRLLHDSLMYIGEQQDRESSTPCSSGWLAATSSVNLLLLAEHIQNYRTGKSSTELQSDSSHKALKALIVAGKITLPLIESALAVLSANALRNYHFFQSFGHSMDLNKYYAINHYNSAKLLKSISQHSYQLLNSNTDSLVRKASIAALVADYCIFITAQLEIEKSNRHNNHDYENYSIERQILERQIDELRAERRRNLAQITDLQRNQNNNPGPGGNSQQSQQQIQALTQQLNRCDQQIQELQQREVQLRELLPRDQQEHAPQSDVCCICLEPYNEATANQRKITLPCNHGLCRTCNNTSYNSTSRNSRNCPNCRRANCIHLQN